jgi:hypothetical protein
MSGPIKPEDVVELKEKHIPEEVFTAFNNLIAKHFDGRSSRITANSVMSELLINPPKEVVEMEPACRRKYIFENRYLDVEDIYRNAGWKVEYDGPGYSETYDAYFVFTKV